jgi:hypothetical protein
VLGLRGARRATAVILDLTDEETRALLNVLIEVIENDRYPMSPRIRVFQAISPNAASWAGCRRSWRHGSAATQHRHHPHAGPRRRSATQPGHRRRRRPRR